MSKYVLAFAISVLAAGSVLFPSPLRADDAAPGQFGATRYGGVSLYNGSSERARLVPLFPSASDAVREGFVRVINRSEAGGEVAIAAIDDTGLRVETPVLSLNANETVHFNSGDLEQGNASKGLTGGTGAGTGDWRLELSSDLDIEVLAYIRTEDGFLTAMHDMVERGATGHRVALFNPGRNRNQKSLLRLINPGTEQAGVTISGIDDAGTASDATVGISLPAGGATTISAAALESEADRNGQDENGAGFSGVDGALGPGTGKWQLMVTADHPVLVMSLLMSPTGHLTNLSTAPYRTDSGAGVVRQVAENTEAGAAIGDPVTADFGTAAALTHSLEGPDAESFAVDAPSGQLRTREGVTYDFEAKSAFELIVRVTDGLGAVMRVPVTVEVTDVDEPPGKPSPPEVEGVSSRSARVSWNEPENMGPAIADYDVEYRRPGAQEHTDAEHEGVEREIEIDGLRQGTDYEFRVRASNAEGIGDWSEPTTGRGRSGGGGGGGGGGVLPPSNQPPVFQGPSSFTLPENRMEVGTVRASNATTYTIANGTDGAEFQIDDAGALQFQSPPDYERPTDVATSDPPDDARNNTYVVAVVATHETGGNALNTTATVTVTVTDTAFEAPEITNVTVLSSTEISVSWRPRDNAGPPIQDYDLQYRAVGDRDFTDGDHRGLSTSATLRDLAPSTDYEIQVQAVNGNGPSQWSASTTATTDVNRPPTFSSAPIQRNLPENTDAGENVGAPLTADDPDRDQLTYRLGGRDAASFDLETDSAQLKTRTGIDYDFEKKERYELTVTADDGHGGRASTDVEVTVTDLNEPPAEVARPTVQASTLSSLTIDWNAPANTGPPISDYDYRYRRDTAGQPWTEVTNTPLRATEVEIVNLMSQNRYAVEVLAKNDEGDSGWSEPATGTTDNNQAPRFRDGSSTTRRFPENTTGMHDIGTPVEATDSDGGTLEYSLEGSATGRFDLDTNSGQLRTRSTEVYDHEEAARHDVTVRVLDGQGGSAAIDVAIEVTDVREPPARPDKPRVSTLSSKRLMVRWTAPDNTGPPIMAYDYRYRAASGWTTVLSTTPTDTEVEIERLTPDTDYEVQVLATNDEGSSAWSDSGMATTDPNQAPVFAEGATARRALAENTAAQSDFDVPVAATDGNDDPLTYRLGGTDASRFTLDEDSGQLSTRSGFVPNHEDKADYSVTVSARDDQGSEASIDVTIDVTDLDEPPATPSAPSRAGGTSTTLRMTWPAPANTGPDIDDYDYHYREQSSGDHWTEVTNTAIDAPDVTLEDLDPDTTYDVEARAHNAEGTSAWGATGFGKTNANRAPAFDEGSSAGRSLPENSAGFVDIGGPLTATDRDDDKLTYELEGTDAGSFNIDPSNGQLSTRGIDYDHESKSSYQVTAKVSDVWRGEDTITVNITVTDQLEPPLTPDRPNVYGETPYALEVKWEIPINVGRPDIASYDLQYRKSGMGRYMAAGTFTDTVGPISGLEPETAYQVQVLARNAEGVSGWSQPGEGSTLIVVPEVDSVDFGSDPGTDKTYKQDDTIQVTVKFTEDVTVNTAGGTPEIDLVIDSITRKAEYAAGSSTATEVAFEYVVMADDVDTNGASIRANSLEANGGTIKKSGATLDASLLHAGQTDNANHKVDGKAPALVSAIANADRLTLTFSERLAATPLPAPADFTVQVAGTERDVSGVAASGTAVVLTLDSVVTPTDSVTVTYAGNGTNPIRDPAGNPAPAFSGHSADNLTAGVCGRTTQVRDVLVDKAGVSGCADVTTADLDAITELYLGSEGISSLKDGDFDGLTALESLNLAENSLSDLPRDIFSELTALTRLNLADNEFSTLPGVFSYLSELELLDLNANQLSDLPSGVFSALTGLTTLWLAKNEFTTLPSNAFADVSTLTFIDLERNDLANPEGDAFAGLTDLERLWLGGNQFTSLPDSFLLGLESLNQLDLSANPVDPLPISVTLSLVSSGLVQASVPAGAPFEIFVPIRVENGSIVGGADGVMIEQGATRGNVVKVSGASGTRAAVSADIGRLPDPPRYDIGYTLVRADDLPLEALAGTREIVLRPASLTVREGGSNGYSVLLRTRPSDTVTLSVTTPTGLTANPSSLTFTADDWHTPRTVTLNAATDTDTIDNTVAVTHQATGGDYASLAATLPVTVAETVADTNTDPAFSSAEAFTVTEHEASVGTVIAADGDTEDSVTGYTLGGADGGLFEITLDGALRFATPPDHEKPGDVASSNPANDADNNEYIVTVTAASGAGTRRRTTTQTITVTVEDESEPPGRPPAPDVFASSVSSKVLFLEPGRRPIHNTGPEITEYNIQLREKDSGPFILQSYDRPTLDVPLTGFDSGTTYEIQVRTVNDEGDGDWSPTAEATTPVNQLPRLISRELPSGARATAGGTVQIFDVDDAFEDPDGEILRLEVSSRDTAVATASMEAGFVAVKPLTAGEATIVVTASDLDDHRVEGTFNVSVQTPTVPDPTVSIDSSGDILALEFSDDFTAGERRAYEVAIRQKSPRGGWRTFCGSVENEAQTARSLVLSQHSAIGSFSEPGVTYEAIYRYIGSSCSSTSDPIWSRVAEATAPGTSSFDIDLVFLGSISSTHRNTLQRAATRWEQVFTTSLPDVDFSAQPYPANRCLSGQEEIADVVDDLRIYVQVTSIDGEGGTLAWAGTCTNRASSSLPIVSRMRLDSDDLDSNSSTTIEGIIMHEIAHALGFGTRWRRHSLVRYPSVGPGDNLVVPAPDTHFTGALATAAFDTAGGADYENGKVPVQNTGTEGNRDSHWRESVFNHELMTPFLGLSPPPSLSAITIQSMADMGYAVDVARAESYTLPTPPSGLVPKRSPAPSAEPEHCVVIPGGTLIKTGSRTILPAGAIKVRGSAPRSAR